jgi:hypothetical protein
MPRLTGITRTATVFEIALEDHLPTSGVAQGKRADRGLTIVHWGTPGQKRLRGSLSCSPPFGSIALHVQLVIWKKGPSEAR